MTMCGQCGSEQGRLLFSLRHRGLIRKLCTTCILRIHPSHFCPICFQTPPNEKDNPVTCSKCYSSSHPTCIPIGTVTMSSYVCPLCVGNPIFDKNRVDKDSAKILVAAANVSFVSIKKAAVGARAEAEKRAKEAAFTRKRARDALERVAFLVGKENNKRRENGSVDGPSEVSARLHAVGLREQERVNTDNGLQRQIKQEQGAGQDNLL